MATITHSGANITINGITLSEATYDTDVIALQAIIAAKSIFLTGFTIFMYDYMLKLSDEISQVWKKRKGLMLRIYLFLRYYSLIASIIITSGYFSPRISGIRCREWMYFIPFGMIIPLMLGSGSLMAIRIYAIYSKSKIILALLFSILIAQTSIGIYIWTFSGAHPAADPINNYSTHYCIFIPATKLGPLSSSYAFIELSFDTVCFALTLARPIWGRIYRNETWGNQLLKNLSQNGVMYFGVIFSVNLAWAIMILHASTGLRGSLAAPSSMIMASFIARITLNLRSSVYGQNLNAVTVQGSEISPQKGGAYRLRDIRRPFTGNQSVGAATSYVEFSPNEVWIKSETITREDCC